jgi:hypothetical protein
VLFGVELSGAIMILRMKGNVRLTERSASHKDLFYWVRVISAGLLAVVLSYIVGSVFRLSGPVYYVIMVTMCLFTSFLSVFRPRWFVRLICALVFCIGVFLIFLASDKELIGLLTWDPGLLGAGASIVALAVAFYGLLVQRKEREEIVKVNGSEVKISDLENGYVWLGESGKYRCEYCRRSGRYHYYKTLTGIKGHIARKHV